MAIAVASRDYLRGSACHGYCVPCAGRLIASHHPRRRYKLFKRNVEGYPPSGERGCTDPGVAAQAAGYPSASDAAQLYDLQADPTEQINLYQDAAYAEHR